MRTAAAFKGVYSIIITPFKSDGHIDFESLRTLVDGVISRGVTGVTALGVAAEAHKLSKDERIELGEHIFEIVDGRCEVIVGTSANTTSQVIDGSKWAEEIGAAGVMVAPPYGLQYGPDLVAHYRNIGASVATPIVLQDYFDVTSVFLTPQMMADMVEAVPSIRSIKLETVPTATRIAETRRLLGGRVSILGGIGAVYFLDELRSGADGTMTGFAYPEILLEIWNRFRNGDLQTAAAVFDKYDPLLAFEGQPKIGLSIRKELLRLRNLIKDSSVRDQPPLSAEVISNLHKVLDATGAALRFS